MAYRATIIIPEQENTDYPVHFAEGFFEDNAGGFSSYQGSGGWRSDDGMSIRENHTRVETVVDEKEVARELLTKAATHIKQETDEDSVMTTIEEVDVTYY